MKNRKHVIHVKKGFVIIKNKNENRDFTSKYRDAAHSICNLRYKVPHEIPVQFHNGSCYDYYLIIEELAEEFQGQDVQCLAETTEKFISFSVSTKKIKNEDTNESITYKLKFIDTFKFIRSS